MALRILRKFVLPPVMISAVVFAAVTAPVFVMGTKQINVELDREPWVNGTIREVALPYVALATAMTVSAGISVVALGGWRNSAKKSVQIQEQLSSLEKHLQEKDALLKELKLSEVRLQVTGLKAFLDEEVPFESVPVQPVFATAVSQPVVAQNSSPEVTLESIDQLQKQLREMILQMQNYLQQIPQVPKVENKAADRFSVYYDSPKSDEIKFK